MNNDAFVKNVASRLIEQIRNGTAPWQKPWRPGTSFLPFNPTNGTRYKGINVVNLLARGHSDARWMTYRQAQTKGYQVRRGDVPNPAPKLRQTRIKCSKRPLSTI
jgi:putative DNA primase/helicase